MRLVVVDVSAFLSIHPSQLVYCWLPGDRRAVLRETGLNSLPFVISQVSIQM